jgi:hypothetical protein
MKLMTTISIILSLLIVFSFTQERFATKNDYLFAKDVFKNEYKKKIYKRFTNSIIVVDETIIKFDKSILEINISNDYKSIFLEGILYPDIILGDYEIITQSLINTTEDNSIDALTNVDSLRIINFIELTKLNPNHRTKRFLFWVFTKEKMNPTECYIELQNKNATKKTLIDDFIKESILTFYYRGTLIL